MVEYLQKPVDVTVVVLLKEERRRERELVAKNKSALGQNDHGESIENHRRDEAEVNADG